MQVFTIIGDKAYVVRYTSELAKYPKYLPTVENDRLISGNQIIYFSITFKKDTR